MRPNGRAWLAGGAFALGAGYLAIQGAETAAIGLGTVALAITLLTPLKSIPPELSEDVGRAGVDALASLASALKLTGRGIVVPGSTPDLPSTLFIPAKEARVADLPALHADLAIYRDPAGAMGVHVPAPGSALEARWRTLHALPTGRGVEEAAEHLRRAMPALGLGRDVQVAIADRRIRVAYEPLGLALTCKSARDERAPWHVQGGCPACSFAAIIVARAVGRPVKIADSGSDARGVYIDLEAAL